MIFIHMSGHIIRSLSRLMASEIYIVSMTPENIQYLLTVGVEFFLTSSIYFSNGAELQKQSLYF